MQRQDQEQKSAINVSWFNITPIEGRIINIKFKFLSKGNIDGAVRAIMNEDLGDNQYTKEAFGIVFAEMGAIENKARTKVNTGLDPETEKEIAIDVQNQVAGARIFGSKESEQKLVKGAKIIVLTKKLKEQRLREAQVQLLTAKLTAEYEKNKDIYESYKTGSFTLGKTVPSGSTEPLSSYSEKRPPSSDEKPEVEEVNNGLKKMKVK